MNWLLRLGVELTPAVPQAVAAIAAPLIPTWAALAESGANPRTWAELATKTWEELT